VDEGLEDLLKFAEVTTESVLDLAPGLRVREGRLLLEVPSTRGVGKLSLQVATQGWRFPAPPAEATKTRDFRVVELAESRPSAATRPARGAATRIRPASEAVFLKERLLYVLQPPLENIFAGKQVHLPLKPYPYQIEGIAFLMPRHAALLADEMGLGKTMQAIVALRLLFHAGLVQRVLLVCPKPLVTNWARELRLWAQDLPFEVIEGDTDARRASWLVSNCPLKLVNYELLTRDHAFVEDQALHFDVVVLDEAQRIKNRGSKTAQAVRALGRDRSWALTGTPIENRPDDLVNLFAFIDAERVPPETAAKRLPELTADCILRRTKDQVLADLPAKIVRDTYLDLTRAQREAYTRAEEEGIVFLNALGDTITVQHVFDLIMRLKQICNFDPLTGQSAKLDQLLADLQEVVASGRKAIIFSQWVEPLIFLTKALESMGPVQFHGRIPPLARQAHLEIFRKDPRKHILLMSYGTGSVGLNLQFANYIFLFDRWWNPAVEDQAINRAHRIGQRNPVFVTRFVTQDTIEGRIAEILERKRHLFRELIERNDPPPALGLSEQEIFSLFQIQARPKRAAA
jgi:SNF2 family DNA or RNA helicase